MITEDDLDKQIKNILPINELIKLNIRLGKKTKEDQIFQKMKRKLEDVISLNFKNALRMNEKYVLYDIAESNYPFHRLVFNKQLNRIILEYLHTGLKFKTCTKTTGAGDFICLKVIW